MQKHKDILEKKKSQNECLTRQKCQKLSMDKPKRLKRELDMKRFMAKRVKRHFDIFKVRTPMYNIK